MAVPHGGRSMDVKTLVSFYSKSAWSRLVSCADSRLLASISNLFRRATSPRRTRNRISLPLPLPPDAFLGFLKIGYLLFICRSMSEASRVLVDVLDDLLEHIFLNLHNIQKNLQFWVSRAEGSNTDKVYFMVFERGPRAFIDCTVQVLRDCLAEGSGIQHLCFSASTHISERITILTSLRSSLATFLAQVYMEVDKLGDKLAKDPENSLPLLLVTVNGLFSKLEASIGHLHAMRQPDSSVDGSYSFPLMFEKLPEVNQEGSQWTVCEIRDASNVIYQNLQKLDSYLSVLVAQHRKPRKVTLYWMRYTCGVVGISVCSIWLLRHSRLTGSPDIDNWIREAKESTVNFWSDHVEQPVSTQMFPVA
ncbi:hypothetical protein RJ640_000694 [Escallonia rubra]|uniref:Uncharacterized protein n=1 Tax=Escallonia rubra TaxID=112253 RepID=A0AA88QQD6_9ASTE|nr:hypothetical protein RJ640_000694 [Escallonia rubra]